MIESKAATGGDSQPAFRRRDALLGSRSLQRWAPALLGLAAGSFLVGQGIAAYHAAVLHQSLHFPSVADAGYIGAYPLMLLGILFLPAQVVQTASRVRLVLDGLMTTTVVGAFLWSLLFAPLIFDRNEGLLAAMTGGVYTLSELALVFCLVLLLAHLRDPALQRTVPMLAGGVTLILIGDSLYQYQGLHGEAPNAAVEAVRIIGYAIAALAAAHAHFAGAWIPHVYRRTSIDQPAPAASSRMPHMWRYLLPYVLTPAVVALMIYVARMHSDPHVELGTDILGAILIELVVVHQFLAYRELVAYANRSARLESLAGADPTTGLPNYRSLVAALDQELARSRRFGSACTILFLDLDHFKPLNDTFGHPAGDAALREFSSVVRQLLRSGDTLGRWGGEEFMALLPETEAEAAAMVAERVRTAVAAHAFWATGGGHVTCSVGVATYPDDGTDRAGLIMKVDQAMYAAKQLGRNQVRRASDPEVAAQAVSMGRGGSREQAALAGTVEALAALGGAHDQVAGRHAQMVAELTMQLARAIGVDAQQSEVLGLAGRLHDIGKVVVPDAVLRKAARLRSRQ
jgi:two-component system cell cycle response regulator